MDRWEYKYVRAEVRNLPSLGSHPVAPTIELPTENELDELGEEGWELGGVINNTRTYYVPDTVHTEVTLIFKRRKP